jgi:hypothetical protein
LKNGTDKKGPQINRNDCEGPQGRTTLVVIYLFYKRVLIFRSKLDLSEILYKRNKIGNKHKKKELKNKKEKLKKLRDLNKKEKKSKVRKFDFYR